jgi:polysaccharide export outer membrane protein
MDHKKFTFALLAAALSGCSVLPLSGPDPDAIRDNAAFLSPSIPSAEGEEKLLNYILVDVTEPVTTYYQNKKTAYIDAADWPLKSKSQGIRIGIGDTLQVTIYESQSGGLFIPSEAGVRPGNFVSIPPQTVDDTGTIEVPFAGTIEVVGRSPQAISREISERLGNRAIEPQAVVSVLSRDSSKVNVIGEVNEPSRFPMSLDGETILDAIARAQGPRFPGHETLVSLQRNKQEWTLPFEQLVTNADYNISLQPSDTVYLYRDPQSFQVFGAAGLSGDLDFTKRDMTLSEALGTALGLQDSQADPAEIFVFRYEKGEHVAGLFPAEDLTGLYVDGQGIPTVYNLNMRDPDGMFLAQKFPIRHEDIIYVANAESVQFTKFLNILGLSSATKFTTQAAVQQ